MADVSLAKLSSMWLLLGRFDDKSTLVQVMAWCQQAITWANVDPDQCHILRPGWNGSHFANDIDACSEKKVVDEYFTDVCSKWYYW